MLTVFSELTTIGIGISIVIIGQLSLASDSKLLELKSKIFTTSFITSWIIPIIFGIVAIFFTELKEPKIVTEFKNMLDYKFSLYNSIYWIAIDIFYSLLLLFIQTTEGIKEIYIKSS